jgi:hypothetical protein
MIAMASSVLALAAAAAAAADPAEHRRTPSTMDLHLVDGGSTGAVCMGALLLSRYCPVPSLLSYHACHQQTAWPLLRLSSRGSVTGPAATDGSRPGFYLRAGASTDHWLIYLQGGGWVYDKASAVSRSKGSLGSSTSWPPTQEGSGMLSADPSSNPDLAHFNVAYFKYCDG